MLKGLSVGTIAAILVIPFAAGAESRTWTDVSGRKVEGELLAVDGDSIRLRVNGKEFTLPIGKFSEEDQAVIKEWKPPETPAPSESEESEDSAEWPADVVVDLKMEIAKVKEDAAAKEYIYRSPHFEFYSDIQLSTSLVNEFCRIFEATYETVKQLPAGLDPKASDGYFKTNLFETKEGYFDAGGMEGSGGMYSGSKQAIFIPLPNLGVRDVGNRFVVDPQHENGTLKHEITHQVMHRWRTSQTGVWFSEGWAEYIEATPYSKGRYKFTGIDRAVAEKVKNNRLSDGREFLMVDPDSLMNISHADWNRALAESPESASRNYCSAMLLVYYFLHMDAGEHGGNMKAFLSAVDSGLGREAATEKFFLRGRSYAELGEDLQKKWRSEGNPDRV